jgi:hypothetical protein
VFRGGEWLIVRLLTAAKYNKAAPAINRSDFQYIENNKQLVISR